MTLDKEELLKNIFDSFSHLEHINADDIPAIDLYMDQVTTFMGEHLKGSKRYEQDKVLTKENILDRVWGIDGAFIEENTVSVTISRLKKKLGEGQSYIKNVFGLGYRMGE